MNEFMQYIGAVALLSLEAWLFVRAIASHRLEREIDSVESKISLIEHKIRILEIRIGK